MLGDEDEAATISHRPEGTAEVTPRSTAFQQDAYPSFEDLLGSSPITPPSCQIEPRECDGRRILEETAVVTPDSEGRFSIPSELLEVVEEMCLPRADVSTSSPRMGAVRQTSVRCGLQSGQETPKLLSFFFRGSYVSTATSSGGPPGREQGRCDNREEDDNLCQAEDGKLVAQVL